MDNLSQLGIVPVDYAILELIFADYKSPRHKIANLEKSGQLIRLKRGQYVVSSTVSGKLLSTELIANHIYGPSYVSMECALSYHGLIPESVYQVKSMTTKRSRSFNNAIAMFDYIFCPEEFFAIGIKQEANTNCTFLIASPEKALCDLIVYTSKLRPRFKSAMLAFLEEDIRLDMEEFYKMDLDIFSQCAAVSKKKNEINNLVKLLEQ